MSVYSFSWNEGKSKFDTTREKELKTKEAAKLRDDAVDAMMYLLEVTEGVFCSQRRAIRILGSEVYESILLGFNCDEWTEAIRIMKSKYPRHIEKVKERIREQIEECSRHATFPDKDLFILTAEARRILNEKGKALNYSSLSRSIMLRNDIKSPTLYVWKNRWKFNASQVNYALDLFESGLDVSEILKRDIIAETEANDAKVAKAAKTRQKLRRNGVRPMEVEACYSRVVGKFDEQTVYFEVKSFAKELGRVPKLKELDDRSKKEADFPSVTTIRKYLKGDWRKVIAKECFL